MNEDYLWDKSGEPDPEIQELEEILAPLRYQPKPLEMPIVRRRSYLRLAIAATVLIALLAGGVWLRLRTEKPQPPQQQAKSEPSVPSMPSVPKEVVKNTDLPKKPAVIRKRRPTRKFDRKEALEAKEQLMVALRLASEKLKSAQRRTQGASPNQIKNQHKIG